MNPIDNALVLIIIYLKYMVSKMKQFQHQQRYSGASGSDSTEEPSRSNRRFSCFRSMLSKLSSQLKIFQRSGRQGHRQFVFFGRRHSIVRFPDEEISDIIDTTDGNIADLMSIITSSDNGDDWMLEDEEMVREIGEMIELLNENQVPDINFH